MSLARAWTRQLYGASGAAVLAPATIIAAVAVLAVGGGFPGLGPLGQLFAVPAVPAGRPTPGHELLAPEGDTAIPAVASRDVDDGFIDEHT